MPDKNEDTVEYELGDGVIDDGMKVTVVDDTPEADRGRGAPHEAPADVTDEELVKYSDQKLKDRLAHLGRGYHDERRAKETAQREAAEALRVANAVVEENRRLQGSLASNQTVLLEQAKLVVNNDVEEAKRKYKAAYESFDTDSIVEAQENLTAAKIKADKVLNFRPAVAPQPQNVVQTPQQTPSAPAVDPKTRDWQAQNPWFGGNRKMTAYALSLHEDLIESGVPVSSDAYFDTINKDIRKRFPEAFPEAPAEAEQSQRRGSNVVASATRSTASRKVVLTQTQVNIAKRLGVPLELYARKVAEEMRK